MENKQDKGFTLVELLIVIVILGILATVTVFAVRGITDKGQDNACDVELGHSRPSIEAYYANEQTDPTAVGDLQPEYLKELPDTAKWTFNTGAAAIPAGPGPDGVAGNADDTAAVAAGSASFTGIGKCAGF